MARWLRRLGSCALTGGLLACAVESGEPTTGSSEPSSSVASVPACATDPYYCYAEPFALGAWVGDTGAFDALVLSDQICGSYGFCFVGRLADGTRIEGSYFDRPQFTHFSWSGGGLGFEGYSVVGDVLTLFAGAEENVVPVATLHRVPSYCDVAADCELQSLRSTTCEHPALKCRHHTCRQSCARTAGP